MLKLTKINWTKVLENLEVMSLAHQYLGYEKENSFIPSASYLYKRYLNPMLMWKERVQYSLYITNLILSLFSILISEIPPP